MRRRPSWTWVLAALALGAASLYAGLWLVDEARYRLRLADQRLRAAERDISLKPERPCPAPKNAMVFVVFGQSNGANHGSVRMRAPGDMWDYHEGRCYTGDDPQYSATGYAGSPWPAFSEALRDAGERRPLVFSTVAVGNTRAEAWLPNSDNADYLIEQVHGLQGQGFDVDAFLFFQGEADRDTPEAGYRQSLKEIADMIDRLSPGSPLIVSNSSICGEGRKPATALMRARASVIEAYSHVKQGPDTDTLGARYRYDSCHFNEAGLRRVGLLWADVVQTLGENRSNP